MESEDSKNGTLTTSFRFGNLDEKNGFFKKRMQDGFKSIGKYVLHLAFNTFNVEEVQELCEGLSFTIKFAMNVAKQAKNIKIDPSEVKKVQEINTMTLEMMKKVMMINDAIKQNITLEMSDIARRISDLEKNQVKNK